MDGVQLQDRLSRGMGVAARVFGVEYDLMRPSGPTRPVGVERRVLRLPAAFDGGDPGYRRAPGYERALRGTFDTAYTQPGDYLVGPRGVLFIVVQPPLKAPLCVLSNTVVDVLRPAGAASVGLNPYAGVGLDGFLPVRSGWPALLLPAGAGRPGALPGDGALGTHAVLLPLGPGVRGSDIVVDAEGRRYVCGSVEHTELGFRVMARLVGA